MKTNLTAGDSGAIKRNFFAISFETAQQESSNELSCTCKNNF